MKQHIFNPTKAKARVLSLPDPDKFGGITFKDVSVDSKGNNEKLRSTSKNKLRTRRIKVE